MEGDRGMNLLSVFGEFFTWLGSLFPRWELVRSNEASVVFGRGGEKVRRGPQIFWWWPCVSDVETVPVVRQVIDLPPQTLMTRDSQTVIAGGVVVYSITDVRKFLVENHDADESAAEVAGAALRDAIVGRDLQEIQANNRQTTDNALTRAARDHLAEFGVEVERMRLTNFSTAQIINYVGATPLALANDEED